MTDKPTTVTKTSLDHLREFTTVVADTGDFSLLEKYTPQDATTNPSLILKAVQKDEYAEILDGIVEDQKGGSLTGDALVDAIIDRVLIRFGQEILKIIPGRVSTEVDARLSFDVEASVRKAEDLIGLYESEGVDRERILIKIASTWERPRVASQTACYNMAQTKFMLWMSAKDSSIGSCAMTSALSYLSL